MLVTGLQGTGKSTVADQIARILSAPVLGHDWAMSGLRPYADIENALDSMEPSGRRVVGWSILSALAQAQLRRGSSVVLDGMAGSAEIDRCRHVADAESATFLVVMTECGDPEIHRSRVEGRDRRIPNWYEFGWDHVERSREKWACPDHVDLCIQATDTIDHNAELIAKCLRAWRLSESG